MLHVAAQGDQAYSLTYFKEKGLDLHEKDEENSTPLHWACFAGSDTAIYYLLAWDADIHAKDNIGFTPLHLAVKSVEHFPNTRSIKELLIKGSDRNSKDKEGRKPIDLTHELYNEKLKLELQTLLKKPRMYIPCCHIKQPLQKLTKSYKAFCFFIFLSLGSYSSLFFFVFPCKLPP